jgi:hypothetical protein
MRDKVIVIGLSKTGTSTLGVMLEMLGYRVCSQRRQVLRDVRAGDWSSLDRELDAYDAFQDWPWPLAYRRAVERYGDRVKFILTVRAEPERWLRSIVNDGLERNIFKSMHDFYGFYRPYGREKEFLAFYERHNAQAREFFASRPGQLIEFCLDNGDGWNKLCSFLDAPIVGGATPHLNKTTSHRKGFQRFWNRIFEPAYRSWIAATRMLGFERQRRSAS